MVSLMKFKVAPESSKAGIIVDLISEVQESVILAGRVIRLDAVVEVVDVKVACLRPTTSTVAETGGFPTGLGMLGKTKFD